MPSPTTADLTDPIPFPTERGTALWTERRSLPVLTMYGVPIAFALGLVFVAPAPLARIALLAGAAILVGLLVRARRTALIEEVTLTDRFLTVTQPGGGRVALPVATLTGMTVRGDRVRFDSTIGTVTLGFVRRQRALIRALRVAAPALPVGRDLDAFCRT
jgi:hypothetical protein